MIINVLLSVQQEQHSLHQQGLCSLYTVASNTKHYLTLRFHKMAGKNTENSSGAETGFNKTQRSNQVINQHSKQIQKEQAKGKVQSPKTQVNTQAIRIRVRMTERWRAR